jgi:hypothetical protein
VSDCNCEQPLVPHIVEVIDIVEETPDVKSFYVKSPSGGLPYQVQPANAQCCPCRWVKACSPAPGRKAGIPAVCH